MADGPKSLWTPSGEHRIQSPSPVTDLAKRAQAAIDAYNRNPEPDNETIREMKLNRSVMAKLQKSAALASGGGEVSFATGRSRDPMFYWRQSNIPYDYTREEELVKLRRYARLIYLTEPVIAACVDVYSYWPLTGAHLTCKDEALTDFYSDLFLNDLDYEAFLPEVARNYWNAGEALPLGQFNATLGIWEDEELINPDDVKVIKTPFQKEPRFEMRVPDEIRQIVATREPEWEYRMLVKNYPELVRFAQTEEYMPVSNINMKQLAFRPDSYYHRGVPIIMRAFRAIYQEEMLNAAVDSIASRLYTPLVLVRLGASATDMGTDAPWVPTAEDLQAFEMALDTALAADFRVMTSHFATQVDQVFGRESMPDFTNDYDRLMDRKLLAFGLSRTMLMGADCLAGDTEIQVNRGGKGYKTTIEKLARQYAGAVRPGRQWDPTIKTYVQQHQDGVVRLGEVECVWYSGDKETWTVTTEGGRSVRASAEHPFFTPDGWKKLGELRVGDEVLVNLGRKTGESRSPRNHYRQVFVKHHPFQSYDGKHRQQDRYKVPVHRAVMEAHLNGLSYEDFIDVLRTDEIRAKELVYLDPAKVIVHHQDENHLNNDLENLVVVPRLDHYRHHAQEGGGHNVLEQIGSDTVRSIEYHGWERTYDIKMVEDPNFLANGFVVHNSGETYAADALNRDLVSILLRRLQKLMIRFYDARAEVVAEAQGHYDYEERGGKRYPVMEEKLIVEDDGTKRIVQKPKLLWPKMEFDVLNLQDEDSLRQFKEALRDTGVPISMATRVHNIGIDLDEEYEKVREEQIRMAVESQQTRKETFLELQKEDLPIPQDLMDDFGAMFANSAELEQADAAMDPMAAMGGDPEEDGEGGEQMPLPNEMVDQPQTAAYTPTSQDLAGGTDEDLTGNAPPDSPTLLDPMSAIQNGNVVLMPMPPKRPPESDEQRKKMPKASSADSDPYMEIDNDPAQGPYHLITGPPKR